MQEDATLWRDLEIIPSGVIGQPRVKPPAAVSYLPPSATVNRQHPTHCCHWMCWPSHSLLLRLGLCRSLFARVFFLSLPFCVLTKKQISSGREQRGIGRGKMPKETETLVIKRRVSILSDPNRLRPNKCPSHQRAEPIRAGHTFIASLYPIATTSLNPPLGWTKDGKHGHEHSP